MSFRDLRVLISYSKFGKALPGYLNQLVIEVQVIYFRMSSGYSDLLKVRGSIPSLIWDG